MATWTPGSPVLGDTISQSFSNIRDNWAVLANAWNGDHQSLTGDGTASTRHNKVTMPANAGAIGATPGIGKLYTKDVGGGVIELVYEDEAANETQITGNATQADVGEVTLPSGLKMKWGTFQLTDANDTPFSYINDFSLTAFTTDTYRVMITPSTFTNGVVTVTSKSNTGFNARQDVLGTINFDWMAIGN
jgi:hypothetical protein